MLRINAMVKAVQWFDVERCVLCIMCLEKCRSLLICLFTLTIIFIFGFILPSRTFSDRAGDSFNFDDQNILEKSVVFFPNSGSWWVFFDLYVLFTVYITIFGRIFTMRSYIFSFSTESQSVFLTCLGGKTKDSFANSPFTTDLIRLMFSFFMVFQVRFLSDC